MRNVSFLGIPANLFSGILSSSFNCVHCLNNVGIGVWCQENISGDELHPGSF